MQDGQNLGRQLVSRVLEDELRAKVRLNGVVVWLDRDASIRLRRPTCGRRTT